MTSRVAHIWRYPIKAHGRQEIDRVELIAGQTMPWDRHWAVRHEASRADGSQWEPCANFSRGSKAPGLMAIDAQLDEISGTLTLSHPERREISFRPDESPTEFFEWVAPLMPADRAQSAEIISVKGRGMTDTPFASISLNNLSSHKAVEQKLGREISPKRWRGNFWLEGLGPWEEFEWIGRQLRLGTAVIAVEERIRRCMATTASTRTGQRDADTLGALNDGWDHQDFGVYATVIEGGAVASGDTVELLS